MKHLSFWFDPISPYAYLAFERLPEALERVSHSVSYRPLLFAGLLAHWGKKGPAEIEPKRAWTFRQVDWLARAHGLPLEVPAEHPFNPLPLLRLLIATAPEGLPPGRHACETVMRHVWRGGGADAVEPERVRALAAQLAPRRDPQSAEVKADLRRASDEALAAGLFGVPAVEVDGLVFWGFDALPMLRQYLVGDPGFDLAAWQAAGAPRAGVTRRAAP